MPFSCRHHSKGDTHKDNTRGTCSVPVNFPANCPILVLEVVVAMGIMLHIIGGFFRLANLNELANFAELADWHDNRFPGSNDHSGITTIQTTPNLLKTRTFQQRITQPA